MKRALVVLGLAAVVAMSTGCSTMFSEGYGAVAGSKAIVVELQEIPSMTSIGPVTISGITSDMGTVVPPDWLSDLTLKARNEVAKEEKFQATDNPITVSGEVIHLETTDTVSFAMGPDSEVVVRMKAFDGNGKLISVANVIGRARSRTSSSQDDLTDGFGEAVVEWIELAMDRAEEEAKKKD